MRIKFYLKTFLIVFISLLIIGGIGIGIYIYLKEPKIIDKIMGNKEETIIDDVYNGIYSYEEILPQSYRIFSGCNVYAMYNYVVIINDEYKFYNSSCMSTNYIKSGKTSDLDIKYDKNKKSYKFTLDDKEYFKDEKVMEVVESNDLANKFRSATFDTINFVIDRTEVPGSYYSFDVSLSGTSTSYQYYFEYDKEKKNFEVEIMNSNKLVLYSKTLNNLKDLPLFYTVNDNIAVIEKNTSNGKYQYNLLLYNNSGEIYNLSKLLPIKINDISLNYANNSVYLMYNNNNSFKLLFGYENSFCNDNKTNGISFYEFTINYDYSKKSLSIPDFNKTGLYKDGCTYLKKNYFI